jgi:hypothetical protein
VRYEVQTARQLVSIDGLQSSALVMPIVRVQCAPGSGRSSVRRPTKQHRSCRIALKRDGNEQKPGERKAQQAVHLNKAI